MTKNEFLVGLKKVWVNTLKREGLYASFRKYYVYRTFGLNRMYNGKLPIFYFRFETHQNCNYIYDGQHQVISIDDYANLLYRVLNSFSWYATAEGEKRWREVNKIVNRECRKYFEYNKWKVDNE